MSKMIVKFSISSLSILVLTLGLFVFNANGKANSTRIQLAGTYQLDSSRSENIFAVVENISRTSRLSASQQADLRTKLNPPANLSIQVVSNQVVLGGTGSEPITLTADGSEVSALSSTGIPVRIRTSLLSDALKVSSTYGDTNFSISFKSANLGGGLQVTRTVKTSYLKQTILAQSFYNRTGSAAVFGGGFTNNTPVWNDTFLVPNGTLLTGVLDSKISTKTSQNNDRFRLVVQTPSKYQGAVIEGFLSGIDRTNKISGTAKMTLNLEKIQLPNGQVYKFAGDILSIGDINKESNLSTKNNQLKGDNKTNESIKRGILGAGIGAVIGAAVGSKGDAWLGAAIGGTSGIATVFFQGKGDLNLEVGSQVNMQSTSPVK